MAAPLPEITAIVRRLLRDDDIELMPATCFDNLPGWDAMDLVSVVVEVECRFDLRFEQREVDRLVKVGDLVDLVIAKQALRAA